MMLFLLCYKFFKNQRITCIKYLESYKRENAEMSWPDEDKKALRDLISTVTNSIWEKRDNWVEGELVSTAKLTEKTLGVITRSIHHSYFADEPDSYVPLVVKFTQIVSNNPPYTIWDEELIGKVDAKYERLSDKLIFVVNNIRRVSLGFIITAVALIFLISTGTLCILSGKIYSNSVFIFFVLVTGTSLLALRFYFRTAYDQLQREYFDVTTPTPAKK